MIDQIIPILEIAAAPVAVFFWTRYVRADIDQRKK